MISRNVVMLLTPDDKQSFNTKDGSIVMILTSLCFSWKHASRPSVLLTIERSTFKISQAFWDHGNSTLDCIAPLSNNQRIFAFQVDYSLALRQEELLQQASTCPSLSLCLL